MAEQKKYIIDHFSLSIDYLITATSIGIPEAKILTDYLKHLELDLKLKPGTLRIFYDEGMGKERTYWYTEKDNTRYVMEFQAKMFGSNTKSILN